MMRISVAGEPSLLLADAQEAAFGLTMWLVGIVLAVLLAVAVLLYIRRRLRDEANQESSGFTLEDIRGLKKRGELSDDEYQALRRQVMEAAGASPTEKDR